MIDSHCHLYSTEFGDEADAVIARAQHAGVRQFYLPAIDSSTHEAMLALSARFPGVCFPMMGLHPCSVNENYEDELQVVNEYVERQVFAAIGEIGLDYYWDTTFKAQQQGAFRRQIALAVKNDLPIVIHSRESIDDCIAITGEFPQLVKKGIFHCFTGTVQQANQILDLGFYLGIGGVLTYKNATLPIVVRDLPLDRLVLETDAPYLAPAPFRGKRNESSYLSHIAAKLAEVKGISVEEVIEATTHNCEKIFGR